MIGKIDFVHSSHKWIPTVCHVGNTAQHCWLVFSRLRLCWRPCEDSKTYFRESIMYLRKPNTCHHQLDVQETNISIPQFHRVWNRFVGCWIAHGWFACSRPSGHCDWSVSFHNQHCNAKQTCTRRLVRDRRLFRQQKQNQNINWNEKARVWGIAFCGSRSHQCTFISGWVPVVHFEDNEAVIKMMNKGRSQTIRHVSCAWLFTDGKAKTNGPSEGEICQLGVTQPAKREGKSSARLGISSQSRERRWRTMWSYWHKEICADHTKSRNRKFSGDRKKLKVQFPGNSLITRNLQTPFAHGDLCG